ncbi:MAG TPA: hypothetical protein VG708_14260 [Mycobacteriales bacterium]|nr:hypothetical protein [Mycobacteriales bacterium]
MEETVAAEVVELLRQRRIFAHVNRRAGVYNVGVRVVIPDGREAIWDNDGAAGLEAMVLRDGVLVGFVPQIPDSDTLGAAEIATLIADTDYDAPPLPTPAPRAAPAPAAEPPVDPVPPAAGEATAARRPWDRLRRRG